MTVLSRYRFDLRRAGARVAVASPQRMHGVLCEAVFGPAPAEGSRPSEQSRLLWRLDRAPGSGEGVLFLVSEMTPDAHVLAKKLDGEAEGLVTRNYDEFLTSIEAGSEWRFRLRANPVRAVRQEGGRSKRVPLVGAEALEEWLIRRAEEKWGFRVPLNRLGAPELVLSERSTAQFQRGDGQITLAGVQYDGALEVTDPALLISALLGGIGAGKAYGLGLLTLAPLSRG